MMRWSIFAVGLGIKMDSSPGSGEAAGRKLHPSFDLTPGVPLKSTP